MSRAVSGVFGVAIAGSSPGSASSKPADSEGDGASFVVALDRAQDKSRGGGTASSVKSSEQPAKEVKDAAPRKAAAKKTVPLVVDQSPKAMKKADTQTPGEPEPDSGQNGSEASPDKQPDQGDKPTKKGATAVDPTTSETSDPAAIVQLQGTLPPQASGSESPKDAGGTHDMARSSAARRSGTANAKVAPTEEKPDADSDSQSDASTGDAAPTDPASSDAAARPAKARLAIQPKTSGGNHAAATDTTAAATASQVTPSPAGGGTLAGLAAPPDTAAIGPALPSSRPVRRGIDDMSLQALTAQTTTTAKSDAAATDAADADAATSTPDDQFTDVNHPKIVSGITGRLLPNGGSMQIRLDPPELGAMQVRVEMRDGVMTASFETSNDQATRLLSHSLGDLRSALEAQGVSVQKLQVSQSPKQQSSSSDSQQNGSKTPQDTASQQEQQRKEMVRRMWQKLMNGQDPVDLVA